MRSFLIIAFWALYSKTVSAQPGSSILPGSVMSFEKSYQNLTPGLKYTYNEYSKIHDYSGNWDLDGDGVADRLIFIGNNGVHLYFHLILILSTDNIVRDYPWLAIDFPILGNIKELDKPQRPDSYLPQFVISDFDSDGKPGIYLRLDDKQVQFIPAKWKKRGLNSPQLLLKYEKGNILIRNYINKTK